MKIEMPVVECKRCGHEWRPRKSDVRKCPKCQSVYFDTEKDIEYVECEVCHYPKPKGCDCSHCDFVE